MKYFEYKNNRLHFHQFKLEQLSSKFPTPFFIYSEDILTQNYLEFMSGAENAKLLDPMICFALKSNPNKDLLKILAKMGSGADIVSGGELQRAIESGIPAERIVFSGVGKTKEEIELALKISKNGIYSFNVESIEDLELINLCAKKLNKLARICFRLNPVVAAKTHKHISTGNKTHKFGLLETDILNALKNKKNWTHSKLVGLSVHIGSQLLDLKATKKALIILSQVAIKTEIPLEFLDVGGGLGVDYHQNDTSKLPKISDYMNLVSDTLTKHYYQKSDFKPRVIFEPGRRIVAKAGLLMMKVIRNKISESNRFVIVDGGMNDFMRPFLRFTIRT
jgi:diaminopimelate decarboxylase